MDYRVGLGTMAMDCRGGLIFPWDTEQDVGAYRKHRAQSQALDHSPCYRGAV